MTKDVFADHMHDIDMGEIDGVTCKVIHPMIEEFMEQEITNPDFGLSTLQLQIRACFSIEALPGIASMLTPMAAYDDNMDGDMDGGDREFLISAATLRLVISYSMTQAWQLEQHIAEILGL